MKYNCYNCNSYSGPVSSFPHRNNTCIHICINCFTHVSEKLKPINDTEYDKEIKTLKKALLMKVNLKFNRKNNLKC